MVYCFHVTVSMNALHKNKTQQASAWVKAYLSGCFIKYVWCHLHRWNISSKMFHSNVVSVIHSFWRTFTMFMSNSDEAILFFCHLYTSFQTDVCWVHLMEKKISFSLFSSVPLLLLMKGNNFILKKTFRF